jgi:hypothetical protein
MGHYSSFVVRVWVDENEMLSKGYVQHVGTQETVHFASLDKMTEFIMNHLSPSQNLLAAIEEESKLPTLSQDSEIKGRNIEHI